MNVFWNKDRVQRWKTEIFGNEKDLRKPRHGCFNLLSFCWQARMRWCEGRFALRPMENADSRTLKVHEEPELEAIASGDVFTVTTSDPETIPLPSWALLETQWFLRQVVEEDIPDYDNDDEDTSEFGSCLSVLVA
ncbi:hypothetical protein AO1008_00244 [Aspergillus oryzae 100-8]|uniref:Uncharacterized protein n=1 Tax=Aspergillus oryzae (strain 3.042) TaxID=1160506 RepID=I8A0P3_ASPO3|nr:hypothetical protein Ao3042_05621 [Aspergillus oryzae 3.042]KDE84938.1 hypothetical protein AO1008_00244 [Aspergillus oryzae 100-8]|eukprot:EIT78162.1 hypothetical protein Ao3042_05621 [Aspergillus oryzae 3.042]